MSATQEATAAFWWESVTGPSTFVADIVGLLVSGSSLALRLPTKVPWLHEMRACVRERLMRDRRTTGIIFDDIDAQAGIEPGEALIPYALEDDVFYPEHETLAAFLRRTDSIRQRLVWVRGLDERGARSWGTLLEDLGQGLPRDGLVLLECPDAHVRGVTELRYASYVGEYSCRLLCSTIADKVLPPSVTDVRKAYAAAVLSKLAAGDMELACRMAGAYVPGRDEPLDVFRRLTGEDVRRVRSALWEAQIECLFPLLERLRLDLVDRYAVRLREICEVGITDAFGSRIEEPDDIEAGTLYWLVFGAAPLEVHLHVSDRGDRDLIALLRDCRNLLAHRQVIDERKVRALIDT